MDGEKKKKKKKEKKRRNTAQDIVFDPHHPHQQQDTLSVPNQPPTLLETRGTYESMPNLNGNSSNSSRPRHSPL